MYLQKRLLAFNSKYLTLCNDSCSLTYTMPLPHLSHIGNLCKLPEGADGLLMGAWTFLITNGRVPVEKRKKRRQYSNMFLFRTKLQCMCTLQHFQKIRNPQYRCHKIDHKQAVIRNFYYIDYMPQNV